MNNKKLINFWKEHNNIPYVNWYKHIGDFYLEKGENDKKIINNAKVAYTIYWIENLEDLRNTNKKIIVVIPALTWTSKIFNQKTSQWDWWANTYWKPWNILDPNESIIIWLDYFGSFFNIHPDKHKLNFYPVPPEKQVEAWKKALLKLWVKNIDILLGWSNWWWHIHHWALSQDKKLEPSLLIPIAWPVTPTLEAKEFFKLQLDFLNWINVSNRLEKNLETLKWQSELYDFLIKYTKKEIEFFHKSKDDKIIMKIVRQIWFMKFVWPKYFDKFNKDLDWKNLNKYEAKKNIINFFKKEWIKFEARFWKSYLKVLLEWISNAKKITPEEYVKKVSKKIDLVIISIRDDKLFDSIDMWKYFIQIKEIRELRWDTWKTIFKIINSTEESTIASHDYFLWIYWAQIISNSILEEIKKLK